LIIDVFMGAILGLSAGVSLRAIFQRAFRLGWELPGPYRLVEGAVSENRVTTRTAARGLLGALLALMGSGTLLLGTTLPATPLVHTWSRFVFAWGAMFTVGALFASIMSRRHAV
jgi:hypothetical protein